MATNGFERLGRETKARAIADQIWRGTPVEHRTSEKLPQAVARMTPDERDGWAVAADKRTPSGATWDRVVEIVREKVQDERRWRGQLDDVRAAS